MSLPFVSFGPVALLAVAFGASGAAATAATTVEAASVGAVFAVIGAATVDSLFRRPHAATRGAARIGPPGATERFSRPASRDAV